MILDYYHLRTENENLDIIPVRVRTRRSFALRKPERPALPEIG
jgi:hypothetical protein